MKVNSVPGGQLRPPGLLATSTQLLPAPAPTLGGFDFELAQRSVRRFSPNDTHAHFQNARIDYPIVIGLLHFTLSYWGMCCCVVLCFRRPSTGLSDPALADGLSGALGGSGRTELRRKVRT